MNEYSNAYTEVYTILNYLEEEELNKIPEEIIETLREKQNKDYNYELNEDLDLKEQKMLPETKAILFNLFRDYLATPVQKEKIIKMQQQDRIKTENEKKQSYNKTDIFEKKSITKNNKNNDTEKNYKIENKKDNIIIKMFKGIFN